MMLTLMFDNNHNFLSIKSEGISIHYQIQISVINICINLKVPYYEDWIQRSIEALNTRTKAPLKIVYQPEK